MLSAVNCWGCQTRLYRSNERRLRDEDETRDPPSRDELRERWLYLCPDCRYEAEYGHAKRVEPEPPPARPQDESLFDAGAYYKPRRRKH